MSSGCEIVDIVGNNFGVLLYRGSEFIGKSSKCFRSF